MTEQPTPKRFTVPADMDRERIDKCVATLLDASRSTARALIDDGKVAYEGSAVSPSQKVATGGSIEVIWEPTSDELVPLDEPLVVRYESPAMLVVDKPAGLVVHPGAGHRADTLANILIHHYPELADIAEHRWGLVHRLDRDTSGLLMVGRSAEAHAQLQEQLKERRVSRTYVALVAGRVDPATGTVEAPIGRDPDRPTRMALRQDGRFARTHYRRIAMWSDVSLLDVKLDTGRTHQIRVHLSSIGAPLVGDTTYAGRRAAAGGKANPRRVWLHAHRLEFVDPHRPDESVAVEAPLPSDLAKSLAELGPPESGSAERFDAVTGRSPR